ncbi:MAG: YbaB/EbfC family nucleoid-associated protein [Negativicutes bacterium]|jgi:hypothetical protein
MFPNMGNMQGMMKQVQKMQQDMAKMQEELKMRKFEHSVGGGAIKLIVSGDKQIESLLISPDAVDVEDLEMLQDMIIAAVNEALRQVDDTTEKEMAKLTGGMKLPPGLL